MAKPLRFTDESERRLREKLYGPEGPPAPVRNNPSKVSRIPTLVRALSATAVGGAEVGGDQCYDAVVLNVNSLVADQAEAAPVWLTILDGGTTASPVTVAAPVAGNAYSGLFAGKFDPDPTGTPDPRPRVFATTKGAGAPAFSGAKVFKTSNQSVSNGTPGGSLSAYLTWDTVDFDDGGWFSAGANTDLTVPGTVPTGARIAVGCLVAWAYASAGEREIMIEETGTGYIIARQSIYQAAGSGNGWMTCTGIGTNATFTTYRVGVNQVTGGSINVIGSAGHITSFWANWIK